MVCTLKHLSLCPEMEALYLFNPENDMALACGDPYYMAPASARRMAAEQMRWAHRSHYCRHDGPKNKWPKDDECPACSESNAVLYSLLGS